MEAASAEVCPEEVAQEGVSSIVDAFLLRSVVEEINVVASVQMWLGLYNK